MPTGYVLARDVGCGYPDNPWAYFGFGPDPMFMFPQSIATSGKVMNVPPALTTTEGQGFFADQVRLAGWTVMADQVYRNLFSTSYPGQFLPPPFNAGMHVTVNSDYGQYNLGQVFLNNAFTWTFVRFSERDLSLVPFNRMDPGSYPVPSFLDNKGTPTGINNEEDLKGDPSESAKWGPLIEHVLHEAYSARDGFGCCGTALQYVCFELDRVAPGWAETNKPLGSWWESARPAATAKRAAARAAIGGVSWVWPPVGP